MQNYKEINGNDYVKESRTTINETMRSIQSMNSGTVFPTTNLFEGMKCYRTDLKKTYTLTDVENNTWVEDDTASKLSTARKISITGNATGAAAFDGSGDVSINVTVNESKHADTATKATTAAACSGNSATATKLQTPRTISLSGNASGSANFDGSGNIRINTTVSNSAHAEKAKVLDGFKQLDIGNWGMTLGKVISGFQEAGGGSIQWRATNGNLYQKIDGTHWQRGAAYEVIDTSTVNNYAPTKTGSGASGTWPISITGNAATSTNATKATTAAACTGNSATASRLATARSIALTGNATGSAIFDGSGNISISTNVNTATNADKLDGYHANELFRYLGGNKVSVMKDIFDRAGTIDMTTMSAADKATHKANINKAKNASQYIWNAQRGIYAYNGHYSMSGYENGTLKLTQSYRDFDKILIVGCDYEGEKIYHRVWDVWDLENAFANSYSFTLFSTWWIIYGSARQGTDTSAKLSTDTIWSCNDIYHKPNVINNSDGPGIVAIYGIIY